MKLPNPTRVALRRKSERGSILVICMILAGLGTIGAAAFFSLMDAKMMEAEQANTANERRAKHANSLALAREVVSRKYLGAASGPAVNETHTLPGGWGDCTITPFADAPMGSTAATRTHKTGAVPHKAYSFDIDVAIGDGDIQHSRQFQVKSYNPNLGGDLVYMGQPTIDTGAKNTLGGNVNVKGPARFFTGGYKHNVTIQADQYISVDPKNPKLALNDTSGKPVTAQNFPYPKMTAGRFDGSTNAVFDGTGSVIGNPDAAWNSYEAKLAAYGASADDGDVEKLDGDVVSEFTIDPVVLTLPPGGGGGGDDDDDDGGVTGVGWPPAVYDVLQQFIEARVRIWMAVRASQVLGTPVAYSYADTRMVAPAYDNWYTDAKVFDASNWPQCYSDFLAAANQLKSDLAFAMSTVGGPDPYVGGWWVPTPDPGIIIPPNADPYWVDNNPYLGNSNSPATSDGNGGIKLKLEDLTSNVQIDDNIENIVIDGAADEVAADLVADLEPLLVVITNTAASTKELKSIEFKGWNKRRLILAIKNEKSNKTITLTHTGDPFPEWRMLANLENVALDADLSAVSGVTLKGGIWTDRDLEVPSGTLTIERETDPGDLEFMSARLGWLEVFRN